jgi:hypothetical protein
MTTSIPQEQPKTAPVTGTTKARVAKRRAPAATAEAKPARRASGAKKPAPARRGSKTAKVLELFETPRRRHIERADKSYGLANSQCPRVPQWHRR